MLDEFRERLHEAWGVLSGRVSVRDMRRVITHSKLRIDELESIYPRVYLCRTNAGQDIACNLVVRERLLVENREKVLELMLGHYARAIDEFVDKDGHHGNQ